MASNGMAIRLPDDLAWSHDPALTDEQRWRAFKAWEASQRTQFNQSSRGRAEFDAWLESEVKPELGNVRPASRQRVHFIS